MNLDAIWPASWPSPAPWSGAAAALAAALAWAGAMRALKRPGLATLGATLGLAVGWAVTLGVPVASPRQLAERLPLLASAGFAAGLLLALLAPAGGGAWRLALGAGLVVAAGAWWSAGAPATAADLRRNLVLALCFGAASALASLELRSPARAAAAFALLLAGFWIARPTGPWPVLAATGIAAALGASPGGTTWTAPAAVPVALGLAGLAAGPVLGRGAAPDWTASAAPFAALLLGPALGARMGGGRVGAVAGWLLAGGFPLLVAWLLARSV